VIRKIGENRSRELFLTGERIDAQKALNFGLANQIASHEELSSATEQLTEKLRSSGPNALKICKDLLIKVPQMSLAEAKSYTAETIAKLRISDEGHEGMKAFFGKRKPDWMK
jgi:methylglutaconyl-CoA hydratase